MKNATHPNEKKPMQKEVMVKTSLKLPEALWKAARIRGIEMNLEAQQLVAIALDQYLKKGAAR
jgi:hypothetical protein